MIECADCDRTFPNCAACREIAQGCQEGALFGIPYLRRIVHHREHHNEAEKKDNSETRREG